LDAAAKKLDVAAIRADFPILAEKMYGDFPLIYFDNAATAQRPWQVIRALTDVYEQNYANVHRASHWLSGRSTDLYEDARTAIQQFIGAQHFEEIIFTSGTTAAINLIARSWCDAFLKAGDEILLSIMEHHSNIVPWQQAAERMGAKLRFLPITDDGRLNLDVLDEYLSERTRIVSLSAVSNVLGTINPLEKIIGRAHEFGAIVVVDAAQAVPHEPTDVQALGADFVAFSGHKMMGPGGVGVLYGRRELLERMPPFMGGGSMISRVTVDGFSPAALPAKFEAGTPPIGSAIAMKAAIEYLQSVGVERIAEHERELTHAAHQTLAEVGGIDVYGPNPDRKTGIVSFNLAGVHAKDVAEALNSQGIAVREGHHCTMPLHQHLGVAASVRASFYLYNTLEEVQRFGQALRMAKRILVRPARRS